MEVKPGYKQTEVGVIPEEWEISQLGTLLSFVTSGSRGWAQFYSENGALFIRSQNVRDGRLVFDDIQYVTPPRGAEGDRTKVNINDVLITMTGNSVGNVAVVEDQFDEAYISQHVGLVRLKNPATGPYICRYLSPNSPGNSQIAGSQSGQSKPGLNLQNLRNFWIAAPPTSGELEAIASALSDVDGLLGGLDRLIAKKRDLKQAAMQQLLTGQTRLPGFTGEWEVKTLHEVVDFLDGRRRPVKDSDRAKMQGDIPYYGASGIVDYVDDYLFDEDLILLGEDGENILSRNCPLAFKISGKTWVNNHAHVLKPKAAMNLDYLVAFLEAQDYEQYNTGTAQPKLNKAVCSALRVVCPPLPEQTAIAEVLSDMDAELAGLEQRRDKTRALKQAMMQELLTGRTRLV
jgi:type I restriction enzyme S subunit